MSTAKKSLGQHWLDDKSTLESICDIADINPGDNVLEIGPGHGSLTRILLKRGAVVVAVELDNELAAKLAEEIVSEHFQVVNQDILKFDLNTLPSDYKVVANIPYYLTSNLIRILSESKNPAASITLLVQKEVAERICARAGSMSILSVSAQIHYDCTLGPVVSADKFSPPPKVDSQVVNMAIRPQSLLQGIDSRLFFSVVKAGFSARRKTLLNSLSGGLRMPKDQIDKILDDAFINPSTRPQELSISDWINLAKAISG